MVSRDRLKPHAGQAPPAAATQGAGAPESELDLPQDFRRSPGSSVTVTATRNLPEHQFNPNNIVYKSAKHV